MGVNYGFERVRFLSPGALRRAGSGQVQAGQAGPAPPE
jgi:hypothetical protein